MASTRDKEALDDSDSSSLGMPSELPRFALHGLGVDVAVDCLSASDVSTIARNAGYFPCVASRPGIIVVADPRRGTKITAHKAVPKSHSRMSRARF